MNPPPSFLPPGALVYAYLRYSSDNQSIASQENALRAWCDAHQITIARTFKDEAKSGASVAGRDAFLQLFDLLVKRQPSPKPAAVLIWSWSRFAREVEDAEYYKQVIRHDARVQVWSITDNIPEGKFAGVFEAFQHLQDAEMRGRLIQDTTRGLHDLAAQGFSSGGRPPIGYKRGEQIAIGRKKNGETRYAHKWELDPDVAERVKRAWRMRLAGASLWEIHAATRLTANARGLTDVFERVTYAGAIRCGATITWDAHPAYVTRAEWEQVQSMRQTRHAQMQAGPQHPARRRGDSPYLVSGRLTCGYCGWAMVGSLSGRVPYYRCDWRHRQGHAHADCQQPSIVAHAVHSQVIDIVTTRVLTFQELLTFKNQINASLSGDAGFLKERRAYLVNELKRLQPVISNLVTSLEKVGPLGELAERLAARKRQEAEYRTEMDELDRRIAQGALEIDDDVLQMFADELGDILRSGELSLVKPILQQTIQKATLFLDEIHIAYSPLPVLNALANKNSADYAAPFLLPEVPQDNTSKNSVPLTGSRLFPSVLFQLNSPFLRPGKGWRKAPALSGVRSRTPSKGAGVTA